MTESSGNAHTSFPTQSRHFKLRLSRPGKDIGGEWLCRLTGAALAYQSYCGTHGSARIFTWHHETDGKTYLEDQEGNWLSHDYANDCLYMSYHGNRVAWRLEDGRLIRDSDGAVLTWREHQRWPFANEKFLSVAKLSDEALTVELVPEPLTPVEKLLEHMTPVYAKRHASTGADDPDRYLYTTSTVGTAKVPERQRYAGHDVAFFALKSQAVEETTVPVYLLRLWSEPEQRAYFKLSAKTEEDGYSLEQAGAPANFYAFASTEQGKYLAQVYEHAADNPTHGQRRYIYDLEAAAHSGWGAGVPVFRAIPLADAEKALIATLGAESARRYATEWVAANGAKLAELLKGLGKDDVNGDVVAKFHRLFEGLPRIKYNSLGAGFHGGYGIGTAGVEFGAIWRNEDFGQVPVHEPLADYSVEWVTFGPATGFDLGASVDALAIGTWFGDISQIDGACNGVTIAGQYVGGLAVTLLWDGSWQGANYGPHPIGVTVIAAVGIEAGGGVFYNASATQFWNRRADFPSR